VLEEREDLAALGERHEVGLHPLVRAAQLAEQRVLVADPAAPRDDLRPAVGRGEHRLAVVDVRTQEQRGHRHVQRGGEPGQRRQAGRRQAVLDLREHRLGDPGTHRELADGHPARAPMAAHLYGDGPLEQALDAPVLVRGHVPDTRRTAGSPSIAMKRSFPGGNGLRVTCA
jgi:hypothetical protein